MPANPLPGEPLLVCDALAWCLVLPCDCGDLRLLLRAGSTSQNPEGAGDELLDCWIDQPSTRAVRGGHLDLVCLPNAGSC